MRDRNYKITRLQDNTYNIQHTNPLSGVNYPSPDWHCDVLLLREKRVKEGKEIYKDWDEAKKEIRDRIQ